MDRTVFETELREQGYADVVDRRMEPDALNPEHDHEFDARDKRAALMDIAKLFGWIVEKRENKIVDEFDSMTTEQLEAWLDERAEQRVKIRQRRLGQQPRLRSIKGGIGTP